jgi:hypothetical protein
VQQQRLLAERGCARVPVARDLAEAVSWIAADVAVPEAVFGLRPDDRAPWGAEL